MNPLSTLFATAPTLRAISPRLGAVFACLCLIAIAVQISGCEVRDAQAAVSKPAIRLYDTNRLGVRAIESDEGLKAGDSLSLGLDGLEPGQGVEVFLHDDLGNEWSYARLFADRKGQVPATLFWFQSGVIGRASRVLETKRDLGFLTFAEAERYFAKRQLRLTALDLKGNVLAERPLQIVKPQGPRLYPSNAESILLNAANVDNEDLYVTGTGFPAGAIVQLYVVDNAYTWYAGDALIDRSGKGGGQGIETIQLGKDQTSFTVKVWDHRLMRPGAFDVVARIGQERKPILFAEDILSYNDDTAVVLFTIVNGNIVIEAAGRDKPHPGKFEFSDAFEKGEHVYAAVDPTDVPAVHSGGTYAAYWVVNRQSAAYWDGASPTLVDVSGGVEIHQVKAWCINFTKTMVWPSATQAAASADYEVIVDFGAVPANTAAAFVPDNTYNKGTDFIDGYNQAGFTVYEDPGNFGPFAVGQVELLQSNGISGITDPAGVTGPTQNVTLAWARIMYPATAAGTGTPVSGAWSNYPVALFLHGRHWNCDNDGAGPGLAGGYSFSCAAANRIPSHEGYNYIMERLASQGVISISISAHDIQPGLGIWDYNARGRLVLKHLDKLRDWTNNGTDPFGGIFFGKIDMGRIALSGHSRGGEGVVAAEVLNATWPSPHAILAVNAIAPTDQNSLLRYVPSTADYFLLSGARDGDVSNHQGFRTYDRAYPQGMAVRQDKAIGWVHSANHNYFNTIWTPTAALGSPNPWAGSVDDNGSTPSIITAAEQRRIALNTIAAFFRQHLLGVAGYREVLTGRIEPASMRNDVTFWTYQSGQRNALDNFEQVPANAGLNTLGGAVTAPGFTTFAERLLTAGGSIYTGPLPPTDSAFYHDTLGLRLGWNAAQTYTSQLPAGQRDVSAYTHLTFRAAKRPAVAGTGPDMSVEVNIKDGAGNTALWPIPSSQFDRIPHPYNSGFGVQAQMVGVRIPLRNFTQNNSQVDLTDIVEVTIRTQGTDEAGIDDIEFGN
jgi:hypothetical protein